MWRPSIQERIHYLYFEAIPYTVHNVAILDTRKNTLLYLYFESSKHIPEANTLSKNKLFACVN